MTQYLHRAGTTGGDGISVAIDPERCMACGLCIFSCPAGTLGEASRGYRMLLGGKLGRNPRLARELPGIYNETDVLRIVDACITLFKDNSSGGKRFAEVLTDADVDHPAGHFPLHG